MKKAFFILLLFALQINSQNFIVKSDSVAVLKGASIRGVSVVDDSVAWISGSNGTIARTLNGGRTWELIPVKGHEKRDFRSIEAFDQNTAYVANAGDTAILMVTYNAGQKWEELSRFTVKGVFFDAVACWDRQSGMAISDPVNGTFLLMRFKEGKIKYIAPVPAKEGEAAFAASGTCMRIIGGNAWFVSGGTQSRIFHSTDMGGNWKDYPLPIMQGQSTQGAFSIAFADSLRGVIVGGDYKEKNLAEKNAFMTNDGGKTWTASKTNPGGYRSCVEFIGKDKYVCTGLNGTDFSKDKGKTWKSIDKQGFNTVRRAKKGELIILAGDKGRVGMMIKK